MYSTNRICWPAGPSSFVYKDGVVENPSQSHHHASRATPVRVDRPLSGILKVSSLLTGRGSILYMGDFNRRANSIYYFLQIKFSRRLLSGRSIYLFSLTVNLSYGGWYITGIHMNLWNRTQNLWVECRDPTLPYPAPWKVDRCTSHKLGLYEFSYGNQRYSRMKRQLFNNQHFTEESREKIQNVV